MNKRQHISLGESIEKLKILKPPRSSEMIKETIICERCGVKAEKMQESESYKWFWCKICKLPISIKIRKEMKNEVLLKGGDIVEREA